MVKKFGSEKNSVVKILVEKRTVVKNSVVKNSVVKSTTPHLCVLTDRVALRVDSSIAARSLLAGKQYNGSES